MGRMEEVQTSEAYLRRHHISLYINDAVTQLVTSSRTDLPCFLEEYFSRVVRGQHVLGREFEYMAATPHNRLSFLAQVKSLLLNVEEAGPITIADCHSILRMLCPDFPLGAIKNAWNTALAIYMDTARASQEPSSKQHSARLPFSNFFTSLEITFLYERFLMDLRKKFFDASKQCTSLEDLYKDVKRAKKWAETSGWPAPSSAALESSINKASAGGEDRAFEFRKLVKGLSCCEEVQRGLKNECHGLMELMDETYGKETTEAPEATETCADKICEVPRTKRKSSRLK